MKGDLRYNCGGKVDLCMDKSVFKRKDYKWENGIYYIPMYMVPFL